MRYGAIFTLPASELTAGLGDDLESWQRMLEDIKKSQTSLGATEQDKSFGPIVVDYSAVQSPDATPRELRFNFGSTQNYLEEDLIP